ncbi:hypothetical protein ZOSMA_348G00040 [Zostera marina]|uniref:Uncharacterized protein n=1 Tax=Zostera marina TaxID=29655 RepID=A0A0K9P794_ZOSMR|nr:hypothetical protein ZOSMA_348G00040 [Zostera marina]
MIDVMMLNIYFRKKAGAENESSFREENHDNVEEVVRAVGEEYVPKTVAEVARQDDVAPKCDEPVFSEVVAKTKHGDIPICVEGDFATVVPEMVDPVVPVVVISEVLEVDISVVPEVVEAIVPEVVIPGES